MSAIADGLDVPARSAIADGFDVIEVPTEAPPSPRYGSKLEIFRWGIRREIGMHKTPSAHPFNMLKGFDGEDPGPVDPTKSSRVYKRDMFRFAAYKFYRVFDHERYQEEAKNDEACKGAILPCVWWRFCKMFEREQGDRNRRLFFAELRERREADRREVLRQAALKRRAREEEQIRTMGRDRFVRRMQLQQAASRSRVNEVSLAMEKKFLNWLKSKDYETWQRPLSDYSKIHFNTVGRLAASKATRIRASDIDAILEALAARTDARKLAVYATYKWDFERDSYPTAYCVDADNVLYIKGEGRLRPLEVLPVIGVETVHSDHLECNGDFSLITTPKTLSLRRLFPKQFQKLESRNDAPLTEMRICRPYKGFVYRLQVVRTETRETFEITRQIGGSDKCEEVMRALDDAAKPRVVRETEEAIRRLEERRRWR